MNELARVYQTSTNNTVIIEVMNGIPICGISIPNNLRTTFKNDFDKMKRGDIPMTASVLPPTACFEFFTNHMQTATVYSDYSCDSDDTYYG